MEDEAVTKLVAYEHVLCQADLVDAYAERFLQEIGRSSGPLQFDLKVPLADLGVPGGIVLEKRVVAKLARLANTTDERRSLQIEWHSEHGQFPRFEGVLTAFPEQDGNCSILTLRGSYVPPGAVAGNLFDAAVGFWIARSSARELLRRIRDAVETKYSAAFPPVERHWQVDDEPGGAELAPSTAGKAAVSQAPFLGT